MYSYFSKGFYHEWVLNCGFILFSVLWIFALQCSVLSDSLKPHGLQHARSLLKLKSIESVMPSNHLILCCPLLLPLTFPGIRVFSNESVPHIRWPKYWSFSFIISPSNEYSGLISFRMNWLDLLAVQQTQESSPTPQFKSISSLALSFLYGPTLTSIHDHWKNHSFDQTDLCWQSNVSAFFVCFNMLLGLLGIIPGWLTLSSLYNI